MKLSQQVKPISYLKAHAPEIVRSLAENREPVVLTVHGEARAVLQDVTVYEETQETIALLKVLALTNKQVEAGKFDRASESFKRIRQRVSRS
ncbi:type II toxin-antitoxin system Phd/YefM family antitoxin (plasmid) [Ensifer adhaerens]|uniref:type II toxin-antitoxin system Phd/YefM family antitoxin n=1 Tax=Ensifer adhaerens TaxID=106592 RepID=UPI0023AA0FCC|nr:type II toxin-antitoxin system Phd/YefM family antitoxin [Ensifer adhaerens]WDZ81904.1 type II toxin-antitoxin system Phd/YefM family antitoxin [Ensifer adhaerens]